MQYLLLVIMFTIGMTSCAPTNTVPLYELLLKQIDTEPEETTDLEESSNEMNSVMLDLKSILDENNLWVTDTDSVPANPDFTADKMKVLQKESISLTADMSQDLTNIDHLGLVQLYQALSALRNEFPLLQSDVYTHPSNDEMEEDQLKMDMLDFNNISTLCAKKCEIGEKVLHSFPKPPIFPDESTIVFDDPFCNVPHVAVSISLLDNDRRNNLRVDVYAKNVSRRKFILVMKSWSDTVLFGLKASWIACAF